MDTTTENEIETTLESIVPVPNGYTNGIINGILSHQVEQKASEAISESKSYIFPSVSKISKDTAPQGFMLRKDVFYPYQKSTYLSPSYNLSSDSKRMIRRLQEPIFAASPGTVHLVYEVGRLMTEILLKANALSLCLFWYAVCIFFLFILLIHSLFRCNLSEIFYCSFYSLNKNCSY